MTIIEELSLLFTISYKIPLKNNVLELNEREKPFNSYYHYINNII